MRRLALVLALGVFAAGCGGAEESEPTTTVSARGIEAPELGARLRAFASAAARGDDGAMFAMLTRPSQASLEESFAEVALDLEDGIGTIAGGELVMARRVGDVGFAALVDERVVDDEREDYAYAVAFVRERGEWRIDLGAATVSALEPDPEEETGARPELRARVETAGPVGEALMWLDGQPVRARRGSDGPFVATLAADASVDLAPGRHVVVVLGTGPGAATAAAWPFTVR
jgi:hypothetical protein